MWFKLSIVVLGQKVITVRPLLGKYPKHEQTATQSVVKAKFLLRRSAEHQLWDFPENPHLSVPVQYVAVESVRVWKSLRAGTFAHTDDSMLFRMQDPSLRHTLQLKHTQNMKIICQGPDLQNILRQSCNNAKVTIELRRTSNLPNILGRTQSFL